MDWMIMSFKQFTIISISLKLLIGSSFPCYATKFLSMSSNIPVTNPRLPDCETKAPLLNSCGIHHLVNFLALSHLIRSSIFQLFQVWQHWRNSNNRDGDWYCLPIWDSLLTLVSCISYYFTGCDVWHMLSGSCSPFQINGFHPHYCGGFVSSISSMCLLLPCYPNILFLSSETAILSFYFHAYTPSARRW